MEPTSGATERRGGKRQGAGRKPAGWVRPPTPDEKVCPKCCILKPLSAFNIAKARPDGHALNCRACGYSQKPKRTAKVCKVCGVEKPLAAFGQPLTCRQCVLDRLAAQRRAAGVPTKREADLLRRMDPTLVRLNGILVARQKFGTHVCSISDAEHYKRVAYCLDEYGIAKPGLESKYAAMVQAIKVGRADTHDRPKIKPPVRENPLRQGVLIEQILFNRFRHRIRKEAKRRGVTVSDDFTQRKGRSIDEYFRQQFGYGKVELTQRIESQFTDGMDWFKFARGDIHLDHKSPMVIFDITIEAQLRNCYHLGNLQPMHGSENSAKGAWCDITCENLRVA